jgi:hypothetical protein
MTREALLLHTLVELADNLVDDFDVIDVLTVLSDRCVDTLDVAAAGVMLASPAGDLQVVASSNEAMRVLELFQLQADEGPCVDCFNDGGAIVNLELSTTDGRWPRFTPLAILQHQAALNAQALNDQLNFALTSRVLIEQAKGKISEACHVDMVVAFQRLRNHARNHNLGLTELARGVAEGAVNPIALDPLKTRR